MRPLRAILAITVLALSVGVSDASMRGLQSLYEQGTEAFKAGNYGSSELLFRKIIDSGDGAEYRDRAWYYLALSIFNQKKYKDAIFEFNRFLLICTAQDLCHESRYWIAESNFFLKNYIRAIEEFKRFIAKSRNEMLTVAALDRIGEIYFMQARYDEAVIEWKEAINRNTNVSQNSQRVVWIGRALFLNEDYDKALELLESLISTKSDKTHEAQARMIIGRIYQIKGRHREALKALYGIPEIMLRESPYCDAQYFKAMSSIALGDAYSAKSFLESFLLIGKSSEWYYHGKYELGSIFIRQNNEKEGTELLEEVRNSTKVMALRSRAALVLSRIHLERNPVEAIPYLEDAVSLPDQEEQRDALSLLARVYVDVRRYEDAERILSMLINTYPENEGNDQVQFLIARVALERNDPVAAIDGFNRIQSINPSSPYLREAVYYLGLAHAMKNEYIQAVELLNRYISTTGAEKRYDALVRLLELYISASDIKNAEKTAQLIQSGYPRQEGAEKALYAFAQALALKGGNPARYLQFVVNTHPKSDSAGRIMFAWATESYVAGDYSRAEQFYRQYLAVPARERAQDALLGRVDSLSRLKRYREIISIAGDETMPELDKNASIQFSLYLGRAYFNEKNLEMSYKTLLPLSSGDLEDDDRLILAKSALKAGDIWTAQAVPALLHKGSDQYAESLYILGKYYISEGKEDVAFDYFAKVIADCPDSAFRDDARIEMAEIHGNNRKYGEALTLLDEIKSEKHADRKLILRIVAMFRTGKIEEAVEMTRSGIRNILGHPAGETVVKEALFYYYLKGDLKNFAVYSSHLTKYSGNDPLLNYLSGKIYFEQQQYTKSSYFFGRLAATESEYREEALFFLGIISLHHHKNARIAAGHFQRLIDTSDPENSFAMKARINLALLMSEGANRARAEELLKEIEAGPENAVMKAQAENLAEYLNFSK
ncbi:MAG TPA: tetratricopeptide repeat protein [Spirochaetota bacterium]|nr:tetratricopeptide repeat protein [Spirochaetota bacterium]